MTGPGPKDGFTVYTDALYQASYDWSTLADVLLSAKGDVQKGLDQRDDFGALANSMGIGDKHDTFIDSLYTALGKGEAAMTTIQDNLDSTAAHYDKADQDAGHR